MLSSMNTDGRPKTMKTLINDFQKGATLPISVMFGQRRAKQIQTKISHKQDIILGFCLFFVPVKCVDKRESSFLLVGRLTIS